MLVIMQLLAYCERLAFVNFRQIFNYFLVLSFVIVCMFCPLCLSFFAFYFLWASLPEIKDMLCYMLCYVMLLPEELFPQSESAGEFW